MTLRQVLDVLWKRKWIIASVLLIAVVTALAYLQIRTETFKSSGTVRLNAVVTDAAYAGAIGDAAINVDSSTVRSPAVLEPAAESLGEDPSALGSAITLEASAESRLGQLTVIAEGPTAASARDRATAVLVSYQDYVDQQVEATLAKLQELQQAAIATARELQPIVNEDPADGIAQANLQTALQKMTSLTAAIDSVNNAGAPTILLRPPGDGSSTVPSVLIVLLLALATGLVVGIAVALIRDQFDDRLRGEEEVEDLTGVRALGELNWDKQLARMDPPLPVARNDRTDLSERLRTLRSTLQVFLPIRESAFVVTSVEPGDGKSFVSANLAMAWSRAGKRVILVGGDLRRPGLARYFGDAADGEGLSEILQEHEVGDALPMTAIESRLNSTPYRRLLVLPSGAEPPDPADLLARPVVSDLILQLRMLADVVIIDSPPTIGMADAALLASHADGAVLIASIRRTARVALTDAVNSLRSAGVEIIGVIANRSRRKLPKSYASYYVGGRESPAAPGPVGPDRSERRHPGPDFLTDPSGWDHDIAGDAADEKASMRPDRVRPLDTDVWGDAAESTLPPAKKTRGR